MNNGVHTPAMSVVAGWEELTNAERLIEIGVIIPVNRVVATLKKLRREKHNNGTNPTT